MASRNVSSLALGNLKFVCSLATVLQSKNFCLSNGLVVQLLPRLSISFSVDFGSLRRLRRSIARMLAHLVDGNAMN